MSTATRPKHRPPISEDALYEFATDAFLRMVESGEFPEEARVYLEDGRIYEKMAKTNAHGLVGSIISTCLIRRLPPGWAVIPEGQFKLDDKNSPLPDITIVRGEPRDYLVEDRYPDVGDVGLVVEIAVTSLAKDLGHNLERYARNKVPNYWVADVPGKRILVHSKPRVQKGDGRYAQVTIVGPGESFSLLLDGQNATRFTYEELMP